MRIYFLLARRVPDRPSPLILEVMERLRALGHEVAGGIPDEMLLEATGLTPRHDLYVLKSHTELALSVASALAAQGARVVNPYAACQAAQDKLLANRRLHAAGVPVPRTFVTADYRQVALLPHDGPQVLKPLRGHRGVGVEVVTTEAARVALADRPPPSGPLVVQDLVPGPGQDLKVYVADGRVWAVRKPFSERSFTLPGRPVPVTTQVEELALTAGAATGLGIFGLDVIEGPHGPVVVDLNYFPGYKGCASAAAPIARHIDAYARAPDEPSLPPMPPAAHPGGLPGGLDQHLAARS